MTDILSNIKGFIDYVRTLQGDEKGEAQVFCDRLFQAFSHAGYKEAGADTVFVDYDGALRFYNIPLDLPSSHDVEFYGFGSVPMPSMLN